MAFYEVKPGRRHGKDNEYGPGDVVEMTEEEAAGFLDKLKKLEPSEDSGLSVEPPADQTNNEEPPPEETLPFTDEPDQVVEAAPAETSAEVAEELPSVVEVASVFEQVELQEKKPRRKKVAETEGGEQQ